MGENGVQRGSGTRAGEQQSKKTQEEVLVEIEAHGRQQGVRPLHGLRRERGMTGSMRYAASSSGADFG